MMGAPRPSPSFSSVLAGRAAKVALAGFFSTEGSPFVGRPKRACPDVAYSGSAVSFLISRSATLEWVTSTSGILYRKSCMNEDKASRLGR